MISLIIATYNRGERLRATLETISGQTLPVKEWELVVCNNNSTDNSAEVFAVWHAKHPEICARMVFEQAQGVSNARNRAISEAKGDTIAVIDDDELAVPELLELYHNLFATNPNAMIIAGRVVPRLEADAPRWMSPYPLHAIAGSFDKGIETKILPRGVMFMGGNYAVRRVMFERFGFYNPALGRTGKELLSGEEKDLYKRFTADGTPIYYIHRAVIEHLIPASRLTRSYFVKLCRQLGHSERVRTLNISRTRYLKRLVLEIVKWGGASVIALGYLLRGAPSKGGYLLLMRWEITRGLLN